LNYFGYRKLIAINLVDEKGRERPVKLAYDKLVKLLGMDGLKYVYFDFHAECSKMRWDRISLLIDRVKDDLETQGYLAPHLITHIYTPVYQMVLLCRRRACIQTPRNTGADKLHGLHR